MSLYASYLQERTNDKIIEIDEGFITYRFMNDEQVYIVDLFVLADFRKKGVASKLADMVCEEARKLGYKEILGTVVPSCYGANDSVLTLIAYGMAINNCSDNLIVFRKGL